MKRGKKYKQIHPFHSHCATKFVSENLSFFRAHWVSELQLRDQRSEYTLARGLGTGISANGNLPGSSVQGIFQAKVLECRAIAFSVVNCRYSQIPTFFI